MEEKKKEFSEKLQALMKEYGLGITATPIIAPVGGILQVIDTQFAVVEKEEEKTENK